MKKVICILFYAVVLLILTSGMQNDDGRAGRTGSPGETTCANTCHDSFTLNQGTGSIVLSSSNLSGLQYTPGNTYNMSITIAQTGINLFGFGIEALDNANASVGQFVITEPTQTQIKNASVQGTIRPNVVHELNSGSGNGSKTYNFDWVAPVSGSGPVTFYYAGTAANGNGNNSGDRVYTGTMALEELIVGVEEIGLNEAFSIYPNPAINELSVVYETNGNAEFDIMLFDLHGRLLNVTVSLKGNSRVIDLDGLASGTYFVKIIFREQIIHKSIIIEM